MTGAQRRGKDLAQVMERLMFLLGDGVVGVRCRNFLHFTHNGGNLEGKLGSGLLGC